MPGYDDMVSTIRRYTIGEKQGEPILFRPNPPQLECLEALSRPGKPVLNNVRLDERTGIITALCARSVYLSTKDPEYAGKAVIIIECRPVLNGISGMIRRILRNYPDPISYAFHSRERLDLLPTRVPFAFIDAESDIAIGSLREIGPISSAIVFNVMGAPDRRKVFTVLSETDPMEILSCSY